MLKAGFARYDITPPLGISIEGYYEKRNAKGVIDSLLATAVAFDDGEKKAVIISVDVIGMNMEFMSLLRSAVAKAADIDVDGVFISCTHTHTGPAVAATGVTKETFPNPEYGNWLIGRIADVAVMAFLDLAPAKLFYTRGEADDVAHIRRFRMKDGSVRTNPGYMNPDTDHALGVPDEQSQLLIIKREGKKEIGIVNFQVHADTIGGEKLSADYPKFVREVYEKNVPDSFCMYINGTEGNLGGNNVFVEREDYVWGYTRTKYMGKKIAMSVISNYELAKEIPGDKIRFAKKVITVSHNKGNSEEVPAALKIAKRYYEVGKEKTLQELGGEAKWEMLAKAVAIAGLNSLPDMHDLIVTALAIGDMVFAGFPGEPFCEVGMEVKKESPFTLTMPACCANGYEGYYPVQSAYDEGGYEVLTARYVAGTAEKLIDTSLEIINSIK